MFLSNNTSSSSSSSSSSSNRVEEQDQSVKEWSSIEQVSFYLNKAANVPQRTEGEAILFDLIPKGVKRVIDLGTGDGHLLKILKKQIPHIKAIALDVSPTMLDAARKYFSNDSKIEVIEHNLGNPLPDIGQFDAVISSFAMHHLTHERKHSLYQEIYDILNSGGIFTGGWVPLQLDSVGQTIKHDCPNKPKQQQSQLSPQAAAQSSTSTRETDIDTAMVLLRKALSLLEKEGALK